MNKRDGTVFEKWTCPACARTYSVLANARLHPHDHAKAV